MKTSLTLALMASAMLALPALAAEQLRIVEHPARETTLNLSSKGVDAVGDLFVFGNPVFDAANRTQVGTDQGFCVRTIVGKSWECNFTTLLNGGQITAEGPFLDNGDSTFTVIGGTGKYAGARGSMLLHMRAGKPESYDFTFDLL
jgi:allene oxide cyclase